MGFDPISLAAAGTGAVQQADAAGDEEKRQKAAQDKATKDATDLAAKKQADLQNQLQLTTAFNSLSTYQAKSAGDASTMFTGKTGLGAGGRI